MLPQLRSGRMLAVSTILVFVACVDRKSGSPLGPSLAARSVGSVQRGVPRTLRDELRDLAIRLPGFTGVSVDEAGQLVISATTPTLSASMRAEVSRWLRAGGRADLAAMPATLHRVQYDHARLYQLYRQAGDLAVRRDEVRGIGIDEVGGRVVVLTTTAAAAESIRLDLVTAGIPDDALSARREEPSPDTQGLQGVHSTMRGGIQTSYVSYSPPNGGGECTVGFVGGFVDSLSGGADPNRRVMTTASHCTTSQLSVLGDVFGQPYLSRRVAVEIDEATVYAYPSCPQLGYLYCRYADVAVLQIDDSIASATGNAARSSATSAPSNPPYLGAQLYTGSGVIGVVVNEKVIKVGRTTGQTGLGRVDLSCIDRESSSLTGMWTLCAQHALLTAGPGDSGAPVFIPSGASYPPNPRPAGLAFQGGNNSTWFSPTSQVIGSLRYQYFLVW